MQLFRFIQADLEVHAPLLAKGPSDGINENGFEAEAADTRLAYPKSLFLLQPLSSGFEMNPVGYRAQESVKVPEGLDLDARLVEILNGIEADELDLGMQSSEDEIDMGQGGGQGMEELRRVLRETETKEKGKRKKKKVKADGTEETPEERLAVSHGVTDWT